jgi:hypothetical protein
VAGVVVEDCDEVEELALKEMPKAALRSPMIPKASSRLRGSVPPFG